MCDTSKYKASLSVSCPVVIHKGLIPKTAMAMEEWCKSCQALIIKCQNLRFYETEDLWCPIPFHGNQI